MPTGNKQEILDNLEFRFAAENDVFWLARKNCKTIRTDVLVDNAIGINFWKAVGFKDYCITMEMENK